MLPLKDNIPTRTFPFVTIGLILGNSLVFLYQLSLGRVGEHVFIYSFGLIPYEFSRLESMVPFRPFPFPATIISAMFVHGNLLHVAGNMLYLWIFGNNVEDRLGHGRFMFFYLLCGVAGSLAHILVSPQAMVPMVGASGAIAGVLGAYLLLYPRARILTLIFFGFFVRMVELPAVVVLGFWILIQLLNGSQALGLNLPGGVAWFAHIGGFVTGMLLLPLLNKTRSRVPRAGL